MKIIGLICFFFTLIWFFSGCASNGFLMAKPKVTMFGNATYPKKEEHATIDIYRTSAPTREYTEFAQIACNDTNNHWCLQQILKKARGIGADAVIIIGKAGASGAGIPIGNFTYVVTEEYGMIAIAIKYK